MARLTGSASEEIDASVAAVWAVVEDVTIAPEWQDGVESMRPLEHDDAGRATLCETESDARVRRIRTRVRYSYQAPTRLTWRQEEGDLKSLEGSWTLEDLGGGRTRATYALDIDPGRVLGMLVRGPVEGTVRQVLVDSRPGELKARVEQG